MLFHKKINSLLSKWGNEQHKTPPHGDAVLGKVTEALPMTATKVARPVWRRPFVFAGAALAILIIVAAQDALGPNGEQYGVTPPPVGYNDSPIRGEEEKDSSSKTPDEIDLGIEYGQYTGLSSRDIRPRWLREIGSALNRLSDTPPPTTEPPVSDNREFLKTDYYAQLRTRQVGKLARRVQTMVRGYQGRIDYASIQQEYASFTFVIPKNSLENFQDELAELIPGRFIIENIQSSNLLPQKQAIETETISAEESVKQLEKKRQTTVAAHKTSVTKLNGRMASLTVRIMAIDQKLLEPETKPNEHASLKLEREVLMSERYNLNQQLIRENTAYQKNLQNVDANIASEKARLKNAHGENVNLINTVETVKGSVSIEWISVFGIIDLYLGYWFWVIIAGVIICWYYFRRRVRFELP